MVERWTESGKPIPFLEPPEWYQKILEISALVNGNADKFVIQAKATIDLAKQCQLHPMLHSFLDLNELRKQLLADLGQSGTLYAGGDSEKFVVDSALDEIIDTVVEALGKCGEGTSPEMRKCISECRKQYKVPPMKIGPGWKTQASEN